MMVGINEILLHLSGGGGGEGAAYALQHRFAAHGDEVEEDQGGEEELWGVMLVLNVSINTR
jgi:hypothetical protein